MRESRFGEAVVEEGVGNPGEIVKISDEGIHLGTAQGIIILTKGCRERIHG